MSDAPIKASLLRAAIDLDGPAEPTLETWGAWTNVAVNERVIPQLFAVARRAQAHLDESTVERAEAMCVDVAGVSVRIERSLLQVAEVFDEEGLPFVVLKGVATANLDHPDPSQRQFGDADLLVSPDDLQRAGQALQTRGWRQAYPLPRHHERFTHAVTFNGVGIAEIDVHQRIGHRALGLRIPTSELLDARRPFHLGGRRLSSLSDVDRLIHACIHAVASRGQYRRLSSLADVLVLSRVMADAAPAVLGRAEGWRVRPLVEEGVGLAHAEAMLGVPQSWSDAMTEPTRSRDRLVERAYLGDRRRPALEEVAHLRAMSAWSDRLLYLYGHLRMDAGPGAGGLASRLRYLGSRLKDRT